MNIGIDIDDTISNSFESVFVESQKFDIEELGNNGEIVQYGKVFDHNYIEIIYKNWTKDQIEKFWKKYFINMLTIATPKPYVAETIKSLKKENDKIILITSRYEPIEGKNIIEMLTRKWLSKNKIVFDKLVLNAQDKLIAAKEEKIDLFVDDSIAHCRRIQSGNIKALLFTSICNQALDVSDIERVYSWPQIYKKITQIKNSKKI